MSKKRDKVTKDSRDKKRCKNRKTDDQKWERPDGYYKEYEARRRAKAYTEPDDRFAILLGSAAQDLFTFIRYPGTEPTNNESKYMLCKVVIHHKIRQKLVTVGGKIMFGTIMTCLFTWNKMG